MARKILLADDSVTAQNMGRRILSDAGYEVITVNNGSAALKKIAELTPDLIVLDVYMPGYGGLEVCQRLKESQATARIPVLLTVGKLEPFKADEARRVRADGHIIKPFDNNELLAAIMRLEDRIVPQPVPSKSGRFAKAIATAEETSSRRGRDKSIDPSSETTSGWKKRLSIPRNVPPDGGEQEPPVTSAAFHDLSPKAESKPAEAKLSEPPVPSGVSQDSSTGESTPSGVSFEKFVELPSVAAIGEVSSALHQESQDKTIVSETPTPDQPSFNMTNVVRREQSPDGAEVMAAIAALSPVGDISEKIIQPGSVLSADGHDNVNSANRDGDSRDTPITALATALAAVTAVCGGPRWVAEPVSLSDGDSHLILESEMEKAYAAFAAAESARNPLPTVTPEADAAAIDTSIAMGSAQSFGESRLSSDSVREVAVSDPEIKSVSSVVALDGSSNGEPPLTAAADTALEQPSNGLTTPIVQLQADGTEASPADLVAFNGFRDIAYAAAASSGSGAAETNRTTAISPGVESSASPETPAATKSENDLSDQPKSSSVEASEPPNEATSSVAASSAPVSGSQEAQLATAWQNWRQIRESIIGQQLPSQIAEAAAAGFKQIREEQRADSSGKESESSALNRAAVEASTIAGIVDSVLSELKPKLMEEIAKKLAEDRK